jgi:hypothetical protein
MWIVSLVSILLVGCKSERTVLLRIDPPSELALTGNSVRPGSDRIGVNTSLREPETVKVYGVNRYVDAGDRVCCTNVTPFIAWRSSPPG